MGLNLLVNDPRHLSNFLVQDNRWAVVLVLPQVTQYQWTGRNLVLQI